MGSLGVSLGVFWPQAMEGRGRSQDAGERVQAVKIDRVLERIEEEGRSGGR